MMDRPHDEQMRMFLIQAFEKRMKFEEGPHQEVEEDPETTVLDPLALDHQTAAKKAATKGTSITKPTLGKAATHFVGPPLEPSRSEKLAPAAFDALLKQDFPKLKDMKPGDLSEEGMAFVAWDLARRYPSSFIGKMNRPKAQPFFDDMTEEQTWDFFYVYHPQALDSSPYIFVPTEQFQHFLNVINASIQTNLTIPAGKPGEMFYVTFGPSCTIRPKYIARSASHNEYQAVRNMIPPPQEEDACAGATAFGKEMLLSLLNMHNNYSDTKTKNSKKKQEKAHSREESLYDAQLYLGLRPKASDVREKEKETALDKPVPHAREQDVVFVCIDIEVAEEHHGTVLEIGLSILDTMNLAGVPPGENGHNWVPFIKNRHLITDEYRHIHNRKYIKGCPELFNFGKSEYPKLSDLGPSIIAVINNLSEAGQEDVSEADRRFRNIVLVGHDLRADLGFLERMGVELWTVGGVMSRTLDTKDMHQAWRYESQGRSLAMVLTDLGIPHSNLHNAGNDAAYTMQAMLGVAVAAMVDKSQKKAANLEV
ncbi:Good for full DBP5 activity protein 2 [Colletotrichum tanaceti]|uniref:Good for full DBP5 activity protein 2 n=1 Tax=Colletotrichum tanaceti TaxID=1306861 RepID=A0A4U6XCV3_9PEZI|nr:Good for full DBP5 activity protein 2 [Colletotrichum tanaceti]TKW51647.1 Good for full DBP5 activity protein 2 [Colletotrichum tanaceti]